MKQQKKKTSGWVKTLIVFIALAAILILVFGTLIVSMPPR